jgi:hypothetical protein
MIVPHYYCQIGQIRRVTAGLTIVHNAIFTVQICCEILNVIYILCSCLTHRSFISIHCTEVIFMLVHVSAMYCSHHPHLGVARPVMRWWRLCASIIHQAMRVVAGY